MLAGEVGVQKCILCRRCVLDRGVQADARGAARCGASVIGMGTTIKHLRRTTSGAAGNGLGATMKYLRRTTSTAANNGLGTTIIAPCSEAPFEVNLEPHTGARPSARLCVGPELARCVYCILEVTISSKSNITPRIRQQTPQNPD